MKKYRLLPLVLSVSLLVVVLSGCFLFKPTAPSNLTATALSSSSIKLSWNGNGDSFIIYISKENPNNFSQLATVKDKSCIDKSLSPDTTYYYEVRAKNDFGISNPSNIASAQTLPQSSIYNHLLLVYPNTDVTYSENGVQKTFKGSMSEDLKNTVIMAFKNLPNLILDGSAGVVHSTYKIIVISTPIEKVDKLGDYYWVSSQDIKSDLTLYAPEGKYDSVHVIWYSGPLKTYWGLGGVLINNGKSTFSSIIAGQAWWWTDAGGKLGEVILHEWLHGVCRFYRERGYPMPVGDADGGESHGYTWSRTDGWMPYYRDLMQGKVWEPTLSEYTGITKEAWLSGTPSNQ